MSTNNQPPMLWEVNLLFYFAHAAMILSEDIDQQLKNTYGSKDGFIREKKKWIGHYNDCIEAAREKLRQAGEWMEKVNPDDATFKAVSGNSGRYDNVLAYSNEFIRFMMLYMDRAQNEGADAKVFKFLRSLPEGDVFPEWFLERFRIKVKVLPEVGDRISSSHGNGTLQFNTCGKNWAVELDNGEQIVLNESMFKLL